ncbi:MAG: 3-methyl-2-oxobutanoate hydroxymethyltransferase, partial [Candidatus Omnitrophica bacterium]|nr:3-methyl-2-oxobutanoate hydroxymethyltransferase [Candidatus Omnitrophota bacterium]
MKKITVEDILQRKGKAKITMLTCYDYSFAKILDAAGIDIILVGDSLANVVLGMEETRYLPLSEMFNHTRAVVKGVRNALVVADMPYAAYQKNPKK